MLLNSGGSSQNEHMDFYSTHSYYIFFKEGHVVLLMHCFQLVEFTETVQSAFSSWSWSWSTSYWPSTSYCTPCNRNDATWASILFPFYSAFQFDINNSVSMIWTFLLHCSYVDPTDPTKIYLQQPAQEPQLRRRTYHSSATNQAMWTCLATMSYDIIQ